MSTRKFAGENRIGLTLLELVVVMAILVALGGLLVPLLGNYLHRANVASCTTNIPELDKWMQTYLHLHAEYPTRFDNLVGGMASGTASGGFVMRGDFTSGTFSGGRSIDVGDLEDAEGKCLYDSGITELCSIVPAAGGDWNPTYWPYGPNRAVSPDLTSSTATSSVATVTETGARLCGLPWNGPNTYKYVVLGMNTPCTLFRNLVEEAPTHFADTPTEDPSQWYMNFAAIFMVCGADGVALEKAKYMGAVAFHEFGLATGGAHTKEWWDRLREERPNK